MARGGGGSSRPSRSPPNSSSSVSADENLLVRAFHDLTCWAISDSQAIEFLRGANWSIETAADRYFSSQRSQHQTTTTTRASTRPLSSRSSSSRQTQQQTAHTSGAAAAAAAMAARFDLRRAGLLFDSYAEKGNTGGDGRITPNGVRRLCEDIGLDVLDPVLLAIAYKCGCTVQGVFTKTEFLKGMTAMATDSLLKLKNRLSDLREEMNNPQTLRPIYAYAFGYSLDVGRRHMCPELAVAYWRLLLSDHFLLLEPWIQFVEEQCETRLEVMQERTRGKLVSSGPTTTTTSTAAAQQVDIISRDVWLMLFDLSLTNDTELRDYDVVNGAWPVLIDEFVEWYRAARLDGRLRMERKEEVEEAGGLQKQ
eukprot:GHVS01075155.1.p1 GENE.GHVS01075155.1~~GHVS01075155.1.p1  ORF type:complete len:366 (-),score=85.28 GHVS01075155.1:366-1463(-)